MAHQVREYVVTTAAGAGSATSPTVTDLPVPAGYLVTQVEIAIPPGPRGELGVALAVGGEQVLPFEKGVYIVDDDTHIVWPVAGLPTAGSWQCWSYNAGTYPHTVRVNLLVTVPGVGGATTPETPVIPTGAITPSTTPTPPATPAKTPTPPATPATTPTPAATPPATPSSTPPATPPATPTPTPATVPVLTLSVTPSVALTVGTPVSLSVSATATGGTGAAPSIALTGTLPDGLTFTTQADGQATIAGTPTPTALGTHQVTVVASMTGAQSVSAPLTLTVAAPAPLGHWQVAPDTKVRSYGAQKWYPTATLAAAVAAANGGHPVALWTTTQTEPGPVASAAQLLTLEHGGTRKFTQYVTYVSTPALVGTAPPPTPTPPPPKGDWVRAPTPAVRRWGPWTFTPIATYAQSLSLAATPDTVYLWTRAQTSPSLPQTPASLAAWEHDGTHRYTQYTAYRRS